MKFTFSAESQFYLYVNSFDTNAVRDKSYEISCSYGGEYEEERLLGNSAV
jgi:hypothetical protein